jgi:K+-transporting ATPase KdpF subunit
VKERIVTLLYAVGGVVALVIMLYLFAALLYPEYFA